MPLVYPVPQLVLLPPPQTHQLSCVSLLLSILEGNYCDLFRDFDDDWYPLFDFIIAGWLIFSLVVLASSSLALLARTLCESQRMQLARLYVVILLSVLVFLLCSLLSGIQKFLLDWLRKDFNVSFYYFNIGMILPSSANPTIGFFVGSFRHQRQWRLPFKLVLQRALEDTTEMKQRGESLPQETREMSEVVSCSDSVSTRVQSEK